jgi:ATP phosphoribosyltransferase
LEALKLEFGQCSLQVQVLESGSIEDLANFEVLPKE